MVQPAAHMIVLACSPARYGPPKFWARNDAEGTWDISEDWLPALPGPCPAGQPAAGTPAAPAPAEGSGSAVDSDGSSCDLDTDEPFFAEVHELLTASCPPCHACTVFVSGCHPWRI